MPANLTPDYLAAEREYKSAESQGEKVSALERMLATLPKHKGTEKLYADLKRRLSQARKESAKKGAAHAAPFYTVEREGAGQIALVGPPNSGKSSLVAALTHAVPEVAGYPFTTRFPTPGMMAFENVQIQLVDLPAAAPEYMEPWLPQAVRNSTMSALVADPNDPEVLEHIEFIEGLYERHRMAAPRLLVASKLDLPDAEANLAALADLYGERYRIVGVSVAEGGAGLDAFRRACFEALEIVRVYTKVPGKMAEFNKPYVMRRGLTVLDAARLVHKDFAERLKFARLFRREGGHDGLMVERTHLVRDEDILEFHI
jgi:ribosome-interacting GTPase 1